MRGCGRGCKERKEGKKGKGSTAETRKRPEGQRETLSGGREGRRRRRRRSRERSRRRRNKKLHRPLFCQFARGVGGRQPALDSSLFFFFLVMRNRIRSVAALVAVFLAASGQVRRGRAPEEGRGRGRQRRHCFVRTCWTRFIFLFLVFPRNPSALGDFLRLRTLCCLLSASERREEQETLRGRMCSFFRLRNRGAQLFPFLSLSFIHTNRPRAPRPSATRRTRSCTRGSTR